MSKIDGKVWVGELLTENAELKRKVRAFESNEYWPESLYVDVAEHDFKRENTRGWEQNAGSVKLTMETKGKFGSRRHHEATRFKVLVCADSNCYEIGRAATLMEAVSVYQGVLNNPPRHDEAPTAWAERLPKQAATVIPDTPTTAPEQPRAEEQA